MVRIIEEFNRAVDVSPQQQALNVSRLRLSTQDDAAAIVDVDAFAVAHVYTARSEQRGLPVPRAVLASPRRDDVEDRRLRGRSDSLPKRILRPTRGGH